MAERSHTHVYSRSALTVWRAVPLCCNAMLAQRMRAQRASHTAARAEYHTLACPRSSARPSNHHIWSDIGLATQTTKTVVRGARGTCLQTTCEGRFQCVLGTTHRDRHHATGVVALARVSSPSRRNYEITASSASRNATTQSRMAHAVRLTALFMQSRIIGQLLHASNPRARPSRDAESLRSLVSHSTGDPVETQAPHPQTRQATHDSSAHRSEAHRLPHTRG